MPFGTAYEGQFYKGRLKTKASRALIVVPDPKAGHRSLEIRL
jgi:hypothetical protein